MMGIRRNHEAVRNTIPEAKLRWLGRAGDYQYAVYSGDGSELAVDIHASPDPGDYVRQPGEILIMRIRRESIDGTEMEHHVTHRAWRVADGTYAGLKAKASKPPTEKPMRTWDVLAELPIMQRREPTRHLAIPPSSKVTMDALKGQLGGRMTPAVAMPIIEVGGNEPPDGSIADLIAWLASRHGIALRLGRRDRGRLVNESRTPIRSDIRELIKRAEELIVAELQGSPAMCSDCSEPAMRPVFPSAPMCREHAQ